MKSILDRFSERMEILSKKIKAKKEYWNLGKIEIFGPDIDEGRWLVTYDNGDEIKREEMSSREEVNRFLRENSNINWNADGEYFPEIGDRYDDKPSFFRHISDADMENVENPAKYHSDFLNYKRYSN